MDKENVGISSAGCQVFANTKDFEEVMALAQKHKTRHGNAFTYILLDEREDLKKKRRFLLYGLIVGAVTVSGLSLYRAMKNKPILPKFLKFKK